MDMKRILGMLHRQEKQSCSGLSVVKMLSGGSDIDTQGCSAAINKKAFHVGGTARKFRVVERER